MLTDRKQRPIQTVRTLQVSNFQNWHFWSLQPQNLVFDAWYLFEGRGDTGVTATPLGIPESFRTGILDTRRVRGWV
ncbi:hypothetical protein HanXRQr2_Chr12g0545571 [Helianthus annuus]|uniref:Uncharacterized protein n=1 Tax=Helianthus annuus TaxID=4232 RepID=A0A9K3HH90_HELAN|nr:hypothetical protein HanXRQr2_Chr12g0545571 [Helianthus annuus]